MSVSDRQLNSMLDGYKNRKNVVAVVFPLCIEESDGSSVEILCADFIQANESIEFEQIDWMEADTSAEQAYLMSTAKDIPAILIKP